MNRTGLIRSNATVTLFGRLYLKDWGRLKIVEKNEDARYSKLWLIKFWKQSSDRCNHEFYSNRWNFWHFYKKKKICVSCISKIIKVRYLKQPSKVLHIFSSITCLIFQTFLYWLLVTSLNWETYLFKILLWTW